MSRPTLSWAAGSPPDAQQISLYRGEDVPLPFAPATAAACPAAMAFTAAAAAEGAPAFPELTVGAGIVVTDQPAGRFTVTIPAATTGGLGAGDYVWSLWGLDAGEAEMIGGGTLTVKASARRPGG